MATAPVQLDEETFLRKIIADLNLPGGVRFKSLELGADSEGDPAWFVRFAVSKQAKLTPKFVSSLGDIMTELHRQFFPLGSEKWAYVDFDESR